MARRRRWISLSLDSKFILEHAARKLSRNEMKPKLWFMRLTVQFARNVICKLLRLASQIYLGFLLPPRTLMQFMHERFLLGKFPVRTLPPEFRRFQVESKPIRDWWMRAGKEKVFRKPHLELPSDAAWISISVVLGVQRRINICQAKQKKVLKEIWCAHTSNKH